MQAGGQYGVQEFVVGRGPAGGGHMFSIPNHEVTHHSQALSHHQIHLQNQQNHHQNQQLHHQNHVQQPQIHQLQQNQNQQHHFSPHPVHNPQQQQIHQQAQAQQTQAQIQLQLELQQQQQQQQQVIQQLGLAPDSPENPSPISSRPSPDFKQLAAANALAEDEAGDDGDRGLGGNRWPRQETLALIKIRTDMDANFRDSGLKAPLWEEVSRKLAELGYQRSAKKCKEKFENVHKYYKKTKEGKAGRQDGKSYRFFSQLEALYGDSGAKFQANVQCGGSAPSTVASSGMAMDSSTANQALLLTNGGRDMVGSSSAQKFLDNSDDMNLSSDSSEDEYDDPEGDESGERKRKRKSWANKVVFFENLIRRLMEKQEAMHRKFLEAIERREQDRIGRDEAWKRQELARLNRENEIRAQERNFAASRDAALVSFLQKVTGQTLQLPLAPSTPVPKVPLSGKDFQGLPVSGNVSGSALNYAENREDQQDKDPFDPNSKRWPKQEVHALIRLRSSMEPRFQEPGPKGSLWEEISAGMSSLGYKRSSKRCKEKWENINKYFRKTKESSKKRPENAKTCPYFHQLDTLYKEGILTAPNSSKNHLDPGQDIQEHSARADDVQQVQIQNDVEMLSVIPSAENGPSGGSANSGGSMSENGELSENKGSQKQQSFTETPNGNGNGSQSVNNATPVVATPISSLPNFEGLNSENFHKSSTVKLEGLVKEMLEQQQQRSMENYERRDPQEWQRAARPSPKDAALIALVHKLAGHTSEFPVSPASNSE